MKQDDLLAVVSASVMDAEDEYRKLLQSIVDTARAIFGAAAGSIFLLDEPTGDLVFEAVSGEGADFLLGRRFPGTRGIAGWVLTAQQPLVIDDLAGNPTFARDLAESTEYVPNAIMAAPVVYEHQPLGVLEVLDRTPDLRSTIEDLDLLTLFARQAAAALRIVQRSRSIRRSLADGDGEVSELMAIVDALRGLDRERRTALSMLLTR